MKCSKNTIQLPKAVGVLSIGVMCLLAAVVLYYFLPIMRYVRADSGRRRHLLLETDYGALLEACRELMTRVDTGTLESGNYVVRPVADVEVDVEVVSFPKVILDLEPVSVAIWKGAPIQVVLGGGFHCFGVTASLTGTSPDSKGGDIELIPGLWYFDTEYDEYPWAQTQIQELVRRGKARNAGRGE